MSQTPTDPWSAIASALEPLVIPCDYCSWVGELQDHGRHLVYVCSGVDPAHRPALIAAYQKQFRAESGYQLPEDAEEDEAVFFTAREFVSTLHEADISLYEQVLDTVAAYYDRIGTWDSTEDGRMILLVEDYLHAETGYTPEGPRPFYGNPRKLALDRWGNRRYIRRRKDGTYMKARKAYNWITGKRV